MGIQENKITVSHTKIGKDYLKDVEEELIKPLLDELNNWTQKTFKLAEQTDAYFMLVSE